MARCKDGPFNLTCEFCGGGFVAWTKKRGYCTPCKPQADLQSVHRQLQPRTVNLEKFKRSSLVRDLEAREQG